MKIEKNRLSDILDRCMESLALTTEMSTDLTIPPDDYSYEYVFNDMLYEIASLDRIINYYDHNDSFKKELRSINSIYKRCFDYSSDDFFKKLDKYQIQYYSTENMVQEMEEIEYRLPFIDDHEIEISITDTLFGLLEKRDSSYLLSRNEGITQKIASQYINFSTFDNYFRESEKFISSKSSIFKALSNFIVGFRTNNLIPNIQEYSWWYSFHSITLDNFILSLESNTIQNKSLAAYLNRQLNELDMIGRFETAVLKTLPYIRKMSKQLNDSIDEILIPDMIPSKPAPLVYGKKMHSPDGWEETEPMPSDHEMNEKFYQLFSINQQAIKQAIEVIESDNINEQKRKETVAILYLMLGENNEALKRLDED